MTQRFDSSPMKLPAHDCPDRCSQREQQVVFADEYIHEKHAEDNHGQRENNTQYEQGAFACYLGLSPSALLICRCVGNSRRIWESSICPNLNRGHLRRLCGNFGYRFIADSLNSLYHLLNSCLRRIKCNRRFLGSEVDIGRYDPWYFLESLFKTHSA